MAIICACLLALIIVDLVSRTLQYTGPDKSMREIRSCLWLPAGTSARYSQAGDGSETIEKVYVVKRWTRDGWVYRPARPEEYPLFKKRRAWL